MKKLEKERKKSACGGVQAGPEKLLILFLWQDSPVPTHGPLGLILAWMPTQLAFEGLFLEHYKTRTDIFKFNWLKVMKSGE